MPILVTLFGISILVKLSQYSNAYSPILVTLLPIITLVKLSRFSNAQLPILVIFTPSMVGCISISFKLLPYSVKPVIELFLILKIADQIAFTVISLVIGVLKSKSQLKP